MIPSTSRPCCRNPSCLLNVISPMTSNASTHVSLQPTTSAQTICLTILQPRRNIKHTPLRCKPIQPRKERPYRTIHKRLELSNRAHRISPRHGSLNPSMKVLIKGRKQCFSRLSLCKLLLDAIECSLCMHCLLVYSHKHTSSSQKFKLEIVGED